MPNLEHCDKETLALVNLQRQLELQHLTPPTPPGSPPGAPPPRLQPQGKAPFLRGRLQRGVNRHSALGSMIRSERDPLAAREEEEEELALGFRAPLIRLRPSVTTTF